MEFLANPEVKKDGSQQQKDIARIPNAIEDEGGEEEPADGQAPVSPSEDQEGQKRERQIEKEKGVGVKEHGRPKGAGPLALFPVREGQNQKTERHGAAAKGNPGRRGQKDGPTDQKATSRKANQKPSLALLCLPAQRLKGF